MGDDITTVLRVLLVFLAYEQVNGFDRPPSLVSVTEMGPLGVVAMQPGVQVGLSLRPSNPWAQKRRFHS